MVRAGVGVLAALFSFVPLLAFAQSAATDTPPAHIATSTDEAERPPADQAAVEAAVRAAFADEPAMIEIARCESKFRQFNDAGEPLDGGAGGMIGVFQINEAVHRSSASSLGFDIDTLEGNIAYARHLYEQSGTDPWMSSFPCWGSLGSNPELVHSQEIPAADGREVAGASAISHNLSFGMIDTDVLRLQKALNASGFLLAPEGPGSPGNETEKFGLLTRESVRTFQCAKGIVCSGDEETTGFGFVGPRTRAALVALSGGAQHSASGDEREALIASLREQISQLQAQLEALRAAQS